MWHEFRKKSAINFYIILPYMILLFFFFLLPIDYAGIERHVLTLHLLVAHPMRSVYVCVSFFFFCFIISRLTSIAKLCVWMREASGEQTLDASLLSEYLCCMYTYVDVHRHLMCVYMCIYIIYIKYSTRQAEKRRMAATWSAHDTHSGIIWGIQRWKIVFFYFSIFSEKKKLYQIQN